MLQLTSSSSVVLSKEQFPVTESSLNTICMHNTSSFPFWHLQFQFKSSVINWMMSFRTPRFYGLCTIVLIPNCYSFWPRINYSDVDALNVIMVTSNLFLCCYILKTSKHFLGITIISTGCSPFVSVSHRDQHQKCPPHDDMMGLHIFWCLHSTLGVSVATAL